MSKFLLSKKYLEGNYNLQCKFHMFLLSKYKYIALRKKKDRNSLLLRNLAKYLK
jgi:hypothetical protein